MQQLHRRLSGHHFNRPHMHLYPRLFVHEAEWQCSFMLLMEIVFLFVAVPALGAFKQDHDVLLLLQLVLAATAIAVIARVKWLKLTLATTFGITLAIQVLPGLLPQATALTVIFIYNLLVTWAMARLVFGPGEVNKHRIAGAVFIYLNTALLFSICYAGVRFSDPGGMTWSHLVGPPRFSELLHLSFTTLTTIGDNQVVLTSPFARSLADSETIVGQLFPALLLSRLVGLHLNRNR